MCWFAGLETFSPDSPNIQPGNENHKNTGRTPDHRETYNDLRDIKNSKQNNLEAEG
jgi:hypothetical protein